MPEYVSAYPLELIIQAIRDHVEDYPSHGINCVCMDTYIRAMRQWIKSPGNNAEVISRIQYVMTIASRVGY